MMADKPNEQGRGILFWIGKNKKMEFDALPTYSKKPWLVISRNPPPPRACQR